MRHRNQAGPLIVAVLLHTLCACRHTPPELPPLTAVEITSTTILSSLKEQQLTPQQCLATALDHTPRNEAARAATTSWLEDTPADKRPGCAVLKKICETEALLSSHGLPELGSTWSTFCQDAGRCESARTRLRVVGANLDKERFAIIYVREGQETAGIRRFISHLPQTAPGSWALLREFLELNRELSILDCTAAALPGLVRHTAATLLDGHPGAETYIKGQMSRLPDDPNNALKLFLPPSAAYQRLVEARRTYRTLVDSGGLGQASEELLGLKRGTRSRRTTAMLAARLAAEGFLPDPTQETRGKAMTFNRSIEEALRTFQKMHVLKPSGKVDQETLTALRISASEKLRAIDKALAAYRRALGPWEPSYLFVQLPHAFVEAYYDYTFVKRYTTVIGSAVKEKRANGELWQPFRTMPLNSAIESVTIHPEWNVPSTIAVREIVPRIDKDPRYLARNGFRVVPLSGQQVRYVQDPGPKNALGKFKFAFPNSWDLYLHDTPLKHYFKHRIRLHSHGCVRVKHARKLAALVLARDQGTQWHQLKKMVNSADTSTIQLKTPLPIHLVYSTAAADSNGNLYFMPDFYELEN